MADLQQGLTVVLQRDGVRLTFRHHVLWVLKWRSVTLADMDVRVSLVDFRMACRAVEEAHLGGRWALERSAVAFGVRRAVVMAAIDRVETALGGIPFFEVRVRRSGVLTLAGDAFRQRSPRLIRSWEALLPQVADGANDGIQGRAKLERETVAPAARGSAMIADLVAAVGRQGRRMEKVVTLVEASRTNARGDGTAPAGTQAADAMKVLLGILKEAGSPGVGSRELTEALEAAGIRSGTAETARAVLRGAGLIRCEGRRWYAAGTW